MSIKTTGTPGGYQSPGVAPQMPEGPKRYNQEYLGLVPSQLACVVLCFLLGLNALAPDAVLGIILLAMKAIAPEAEATRSLYFIYQLNVRMQSVHIFFWLLSVVLTVLAIWMRPYMPGSRDLRNQICEKIMARPEAVRMFPEDLRCKVQRSSGVYTIKIGINALQLDLEQERAIIADVLRSLRLPDIDIRLYETPGMKLGSADYHFIVQTEARLLPWLRSHGMRVNGY